MKLFINFWPHAQVEVISLLENISLTANDDKKDAYIN